MSWRSLTLWGLPLLLALGAFAVALGGGFVMDDWYAITNNPVVTGAAPIEEIFTCTFWGAPLDAPPPAYRPLATLTFRLDHALFGASPIAFHATSLAWYLVSVHVGQRLALGWLEPAAACLAACLFASLPLHAENAASLVARADTLALVGSLVALVALGPALRGGRASPRRVIGAAFAYAAALLCKESAALLPLIVALCIEFGSERGGGLRALARRHVPTVVLGAVGAGYLACRLWILPTTFGGYHVPDDVLEGAAVWQRVAFALGLVWEYARLLVAPADLCTGRKFAEVARPQGLEWPTVAGAVLLGLVAWHAVRAWRRREPPWLLCAVVSWFVFSSLAFPAPEAMADRFFIAPSYFLLVPAGASIARHATRRPWLWIPVGVLLAGQVAASAFHASRWRDDDTLLAHAVVACPRSVHNQVRHARRLSRQGRHAEAAWHFALAASARRRFPSRWDPPNRDAEATLSAAERLRRLHELLGAGEPEAAWRAALAGAMAREGFRAEAELVMRAAPARPRQR